MKNTKLYTKRLVLEGLNLSHSEAIVGFRSREEVYKYFKNPHKISIEEHNAWFENRYLADETRLDFVIKLESSGEIVGTCGISDLNISDGSMEVSYLLAPDFQGKGYASEAVNALIEYGFLKWGIKCVFATIHKDNKPSIKFVEKLNFQLVNTDGDFLEYRYDRD